MGNIKLDQNPENQLEYMRDAMTASLLGARDRNGGTQQKGRRGVKTVKTPLT